MYLETCCDTWARWDAARSLLYLLLTPVKLKTNDGEKESLSCTDLCIPTSPPFTPSFCHPAFSLSAPFVPLFFFSAHPKGLLLQLESPILCMCVCFSGCWTHRSGFSGGLRSQQRLIVRIVGSEVTYVSCTLLCASVIISLFSLFYSS